MTTPTTDATAGPKRTGLTLSGGGFRAMLFHLGVVRFLYEEKKLKDVTHICSVSGGSILAAHLVLNWERYTGTPQQFDEAAGELVRFAQCDLRGRVVRPWLFSWAALGLPRRLQRRKWWRTSLLQKEYDRLLKGAKLGDLPAPGRPELHILATSFTTGHLVAFGNRRVQFVDDPLSPAAGRHHPPEVYADAVPVAMAVAASSAFPPMFPPVRLDYHTFGQDRNVLPQGHCLTDGGVFDNLGIRRLLWLFKPEERLDMIVVSDAQRSLTLEYENEYNLALGRTSRCVDLLMTRVSVFESESAASAIHRDHGHLLRCRLADQVTDRKYALSAVEQSAVRTARTDLDDFSDDEIDAIIHHGYAVARAAAEEDPAVPCPAWDGKKVWTPAKPDRTGGYEIERIGKRRLGLFRPTHWASLALWGMIAFWVALPLVIIGVLSYRANERATEAATAQTAAEEAERKQKEAEAETVRKVKEAEDQARKQREAEEQARKRNADHVVKKMKIVRMLSEVLISGNPQSAKKKYKAWQDFTKELREDEWFKEYLTRPIVKNVEKALEASLDKPFPPSPEARQSLLDLATELRSYIVDSDAYLDAVRQTRAEVYAELGEHLDTILAPKTLRLTDTPVSRRQFWRLCWGPMTILEDEKSDVRKAMDAFLGLLLEWENTEKDATLEMEKDLRVSAAKLKKACQAELDKK